MTMCARSHLGTHALANPSSSWLHRVKVEHGGICGSAVVFVATVTRWEIDGFGCGAFFLQFLMSVFYCIAFYCAFWCILGYIPFPERATASLHRLLQAFSGPLGQYRWVMELAQPCKGMDESLFGCKRKSQWLLQQAQKSLLNVFELSSPTLLFPKGMIFSRS